MYKIIENEQELLRFISFLPDLTPDEKFYVTLFARKKYTSDPRFRADKTQLKRLTVNKQDLVTELKKLEVAYGLYKFDDIEIPQHMLAVYINPNPRSMSRASLELLSRIADKLKNGHPLGNPKSEAMNCIQVTPSRKIFFDIDIDAKPNVSFGVEDLRYWIGINDIINFDSLTTVKTRGGFHILVNLESVDPRYKKSWYQSFIKKTPEMPFDVMMNSDNLIPIPGCVQGGSTPSLLNIY